MKINRVWEMPNSRTFKIKAIKEIIEKYSYGVVIDPFANSNKLALQRLQLWLFAGLITTSLILLMILTKQ